MNLFTTFYGATLSQLLDMPMTIILPLPSPVLSPNGAHGHWSRTHKARKQARNLAKLTTLSALNPTSAAMPPPSGYRLRYYYKVHRRRDDDNLIAMSKSYRDGIADALGMDDADLRIADAPTTETDRSNPRLEIDLIP